MRKTVFILFMMIVGLGTTAVKAQDASAGNKAALTFAATEHDFGDISDKNKVSYAFEITNTGKSPLVITKQVVSCKCIDVDCRKKPIAPGAKASLTVTYNPRKQQGVFYKAIQVYSNDPAGRHVITVKGKVVPQHRQKEKANRQ